MARFHKSKLVEAFVVIAVALASFSCTLDVACMDI